jgi:hypothetical protein
MGKVELEAQIAEMHRLMDAATEGVGLALASGQLVGCPECGDPLAKDEFMVICYPTSRNTLRTTAVHPGCVPPEARDMGMVED